MVFYSTGGGICLFKCLPNTADRATIINRVVIYMYDMNIYKHEWLIYRIKAWCIAERDFKSVSSYVEFADTVESTVVNKGESVDTLSIVVEIPEVASYRVEYTIL